MPSISGYGHEYEHPVSKKVAETLAGEHALPEMGSEIQVAEGQLTLEGMPWGETLYLQNISGTFVLASSGVKTDEWDEIFSLKVGHPNKATRLS